jgi:hypothetical protein
MSDWTDTCIQMPNGGWMRFEDYCNSQPKGTSHLYTSSILTPEDEQNAVELGARVANDIAEWDIDHWDALMDLLVTSL